MDYQTVRSPRLEAPLLLHSVCLRSINFLHLNFFPNHKNEMKLVGNFLCVKKLRFLYNIKTETDGTRNYQCFILKFKVFFSYR